MGPFFRDPRVHEASSDALLRAKVQTLNPKPQSPIPNRRPSQGRGLGVGVGV
jgi:hypothetical protein